MSSSVARLLLAIRLMYLVMASPFSVQKMVGISSPVKESLQRLRLGAPQAPAQNTSREGRSERAAEASETLEERAMCPFTMETVTFGGDTLTEATCVSTGEPCAGGMPFTVCQQLTQTVLIEGHSLELNTACLCALRAPWGQREAESRRRRSGSPKKAARFLHRRQMARMGSIRGRWRRTRSR